MLKSWTQSNLHWSILQHRYDDLKRLCCRGNPFLPISGLVGNPKPSYFPRAGLIFDGSGNLYGTIVNGGTNSYGTAFEFSPAGGGNWTETVLHSFGGSGDGAVPYSGLIFDRAGNLYGTTVEGGVGTSAFGTVFEIAP